LREPEVFICSDYGILGLVSVSNLS